MVRLSDQMSYSGKCSLGVEFHLELVPKCVHVFFKIIVFIIYYFFNEKQC